MTAVVVGLVAVGAIAAGTSSAFGKVQAARAPSTASHIVAKTNPYLNTKSDASAGAVEAGPGQDVHPVLAAYHKSSKKVSRRSHAHKKATYPNNVDGWIRHSLTVMHSHGIPGTYSGIHRNLMRESSGNPNAINKWDSNAAAGIPSKGLLQVIDPTFREYHVKGTSWNIYNPVANITAACNYAAHRYGSIDNVNSAY
ncbi:transglycosylase SLT domain-containing protein [Streptomyces sp. NPDC091376]|uniref:transglycosylase SLT domain-containing protein n=1 Tax=Streptomyces sp. NPDC091376 TaxID=3365994 RepID=UPI0037FD2E08